MNKDLQSISDLIQQSAHLSDEEKKSILKSLKDANKEFEITSFKLDRTEKVKRTTAILLEETIEELEKKRKAVEAQNKELEIESSLERVRTVAMSMNEPDDMLHVCRTIAEQLELLKVKEIRNVQTAIFYEEKGSYMNYEYYAKHNKTFITNTTYTDHKIQQEFSEKMLKGNGEFMTAHINADELKEWVAYQKTTNVFIDDYLNTASSLDYYWFSLGPVALGISTYVPLSDEQINLFKRFLKVFELSYRRYLDIELAIKQAKEARIETALERVRAVAMAMRKPDDLLDVCEILYEEFHSLGFSELRNSMINIYNDDNGSLFNYDYSESVGKTITHFVYNTHPTIDNLVKNTRGANDAFIEYAYTGKELDEWREFRKKSGEADDARLNNAEAIYYYFYSIGTGSIGISTFSTIGEEKLEVLKRFRNVFNLSYQRYIDLALADAQAKEAKIEASLERMRAAAMSMRKSEELISVCEAMYKELTVLGFANIRNAQIAIKNESRQSYFISEYSDHAVTVMKEAPYNSSPLVKLLYEEMENSKDALYQKEFSGKEFDEWRAWRKNVGAAIDIRIEQANSMCFYLYSFGKGYLGISTFNAITKDHLEILKRFKNVFELSYTRYIDVAQAEAQARESQIELALERVRARTMAMQKSDELPDAANLLFQQMQALGMPAWSVGYCIWDKNKKGITLWMSSEGVMQPSFHTPLTEDPSFIHFRKAYERGESFHVEAVGGDELVSHYKYMRTLPGIGEVLDSIINAGHPLPTFQIFHCAYFSQGFLLFITYEPVLEAHDIFKRFAKVFEQTYTRFLDLQKAEAQARESQIQLALERVRARTMAMQKSDELSETVFILFQQFKQLGENPDQATIGIINEEEWVIEYWVTMYGNQTNRVYKFPIDEPNVTNRIYKAWKEQKKSLVIELSGKELYDFANFRESMGGAAYKPEEKKRVINVAFFSKGIINVQSNESRSEESIRLLERFAGVFEQTYTRFLDLKKAEAQARESQIEAALERVRSRSMAMQKSEELKEVIQVVYDQFVHLNIPTEHTGFVMDYRTRDDYNLWIADRFGSPSQVTIPYFDSIYYNSFNRAKENGIDFFVTTLSFEEKNKFYEELFNHVPGLPEESQKIIFNAPGYSISTALLENVSLYIENFSGIPFSDEENAILIRFGKVFQQTYTRFLDLQKAEAQALAAIKRASVDRVRAEIASMRSTKDLERITPLIWNELTVLGIPFIRCGVFIMDEEQQKVQTFLYTEGKTIASFTSTYSNSRIIIEALPYWRKKEIYKTHWDEAAFLEQAKSLVEQGAITSGEKYLTEHRPIDLYLHFLPFLQGMLYVGDATPLSEEHLELVQALADAFSTAYARYEDFNRLEAAKQQVDKTLVNLKQTQTQLIQSEKMASLGELTAGIAHEIQNPLNFVNNFSEVSNELIGEMFEEVDKGNTEEVKAIANDIRQNLEKINHHGKRADAIVKGMLQHSRSSTGVKEPTNINVLADEYLRLAYHGLRGKDKSFNASMKTDFDQAIDKINIIPQDIGRVLLNLYTNAFYAVAEKKKQQPENYEPTISIITKLLKAPSGVGVNQVSITVSDNGNGIPQKIIDKIFQPFFTTKPTGQGTGLGLSLAYDIVKAHGGEIKVESKEGEGTTFIIQLPTK